MTTTFKIKFGLVFIRDDAREGHCGDWDEAG